MRTATLPDIFASYNDCFEVATTGGLQPSVLSKLGWTRATVEKDGKQVPSEPAIFSHSARAPLIILSGEAGEGLCIVTAKLESDATFEQFKNAFGGKLPAPDAKGDIGFKAEGRPIILKRTGSKAQPAMSILVMTPPEKK